MPKKNDIQLKVVVSCISENQLYKLNNSDKIVQVSCIFWKELKSLISFAVSSTSKYLKPIPKIVNPSNGIKKREASIISNYKRAAIYDTTGKV